MDNLASKKWQRIIVDWNHTYRDFPHDKCLHHLFEKQVARTPNGVAVIYEKKQKAYLELNRDANQLAHYLQALGVGPDTLVGVFMERSLEMVTALLAILKAGGAYVPLDPEYPSDRLKYMLEDTSVPVLLTQQRLADEAPEYEGQVIFLDSDWPIIAKQKATNPQSNVNANHLAYVIYTSGSTGRPKGVMNSHKGICNRLLWGQETYKLTQKDRVLQKTPFSFDVSVWEFFWPLIAGSTLIVAKPGGHRDSAYLVDLIYEYSITTIHFVPSMLHIFLEEKRLNKCASLKRVMCSGEALPYDLQERFFRLLNAELHNLYGPTEAAVEVTYWACQQNSIYQFVPIGRPVANTQIYILNKKMQPVPIGAPGELHIGGIQVARGYLNLPSLTAEKFVSDPFRGDAKSRLYKTGDLACYQPDGAIKYLGRIDHQVKVRGNRIELGEVETVLNSHAAVKQSVVVARDDNLMDIRLVAYMVPNIQQSIDNSKIRLYLREKLPNYMVPNIFIALKELPLSPNGKIDRKALPEPVGKRPEMDQAYVAHHGALEGHLSDMWRDILKLDRVGINDKFFELGGTSLQAAKFVNKLQEELNEDIYIVSIFDSPSIAEYAAFLKKTYPEAIAKRYGVKIEASQNSNRLRDDSANDMNINAAAISKMRNCIPSFISSKYASKHNEKNPSAIFILAPHRSGTTLLRVMLAGHPRLFAAAELQLLGFNTLTERRNAFSGKFSFWLEGAIRAIMQIKRCDAVSASQIMEKHESNSTTTKQFYRLLQTWIKDKVLLDRSLSYVLDLEVLAKAERDFENPLYIHLIRHPVAAIDSFCRHHMEQVLFLKRNQFTQHQIAELLWVISHQNAIDFLNTIPKRRQYHLRFEDLLNKPKSAIQSLCLAFGFEFHHSLLDPYNNIEEKMVDGIYKDSKPMGDADFLKYRFIDPTAAERWKVTAKNFTLSENTWELASHFGYKPFKASINTASRYAKIDRRQLAGYRNRLLEKRRKIRQGASR